MLIKKMDPPPKVDLIHEILSQEENIKIIINLINSPWHLAKDHSRNPLQDVLKFNRGFTYCVFNSNKNYAVDIQDGVGKDAHIIYEKIKTKARIKSDQLIRLNWNMYLKNSKPKFHRDIDEEGYKSIVYDLHTTDGSTCIGGHFYNDKMGQAKIFDSNLLHRGVIPKNDNIRFNLNIIYKCDTVK